MANEIKIIQQNKWYRLWIDPKHYNPNDPLSFANGFELTVDVDFDNDTIKANTDGKHEVSPQTFTLSENGVKFVNGKTMPFKTFWQSVLEKINWLISNSNLNAGTISDEVSRAIMAELLLHDLIESEISDRKSGMRELETAIGNEAIERADADKELVRKDINADKRLVHLVSHTVNESAITFVITSTALDGTGETQMSFALPVASGTSAGFINAALYSAISENTAKLAGIEPGAQANIQPDWNATTGGAEILNKPDLSGFILSSQKGVVGGIAPLGPDGYIPNQYLPGTVSPVVGVETYNDLPVTGQSNVIYSVHDTNKIYRWDGTKYIEISPSLTLGMTIETAYPGNLGAAATAVIAELQSGKIDKNGTDRLITVAEAIKLSGLSNPDWMIIGSDVPGQLFKEADNTGSVVGWDSMVNSIADLTVNLSAHKNDKENPHTVTKAQVGLGNVDNTSDANKPISTAATVALGGKVDRIAGKGLSTNDYDNAEKTKVSGAIQSHKIGIANGVAGLDADMKLLIANLPSEVITLLTATKIQTDLGDFIDIDANGKLTWNNNMYDYGSITE